MESILISIKKLLGITADYNHFDADIIIHINSILSVLTQMGVGPSEGFSIQDEFAKWTDFIPNTQNVELVKTYVHQRVRMIFDPPTNSSVIEAIQRSIAELEWRISVIADRGAV